MRPRAQPKARLDTGRDLRWTATLAMAAAVAVLSVATAIADREPVPLWSVPAALLLAGFGSCAVAQAPSTKRLLAGLVGGGGVWAAAAVLAESPILATIGGMVAGVPVVLGQALAILLAQSIGARAGALRSLRTAGGVVLVLAVLPLPYALLVRHATVTVDHADRGAIDDHAAAFNGVTLGAAAANVELIMGSAPRWTPAQSIAPLAADSEYDGPSSLDYGQPPRDTFLRYPGASFAIRRGRVRWIQIDDQAKATVAGLGPGDSISLVKRFYPSARCGEDTLHSEPSYIPYPYCQQRLRSHRWLTFFGSYRRPGTPITAIWLSTSRLE